MTTDYQKAAELTERLHRHPHLLASMEHLLIIAEAEGDGLIKADDAERQTIEEVKRLGGKLLTEWAEKRIERCAEEQREVSGISRSGKKTPLA